MGDNSVFIFLNPRLILIAIFIVMTPLFIPYVFAMECQQNSDSSFELILNCVDTIDVKKNTMELMYGDVSKFSNSLDGAKVYDIKFEDSATFATLEIPLPLANSLKSDVKFTKSSNYLLEFLNGDLGGSSLSIALQEINGYDGTKNGASEVSFSFKINKVPCFAFGLKCGTADDFEYALDRGLYLIESKAQILQGNLDKKNENQNNSISSDTKPNQLGNQKENKKKSELNTIDHKVTQIADSEFFDKSDLSDMEEIMTEESMEIKTLSPSQQSSQGIMPQDVICKDDLQKLYKYNGSPVCVSEYSVDKLIARGWVKDLTF